MGQTTSEEAGKKAEQLEDRSPTPTLTDVLMEEEEEEEEAKKTGEEKGKEREEQERRGSTQGRQDTETAEAEGGRKRAEEDGGEVAKEPEGVKTRGQKRRARLRPLKLHGQNAPQTASPRHCEKIVYLGGT